MKINYIQKVIDQEHLDCLWYGGRVAEVEHKGYTFILGAYGDVYCTLLDNDGNEIAETRDKNNGGEFYLDMRRYIANDKELNRARYYGEIDPDEREMFLEFENSNWWEVLIDAPDGSHYDFGWVCESDDYTGALDEVLGNIDDTIEYIEEGNKNA